MEAGQALPELAAVPWRQPTDARWLHRWGRIWHAWTLLYTVPFIAAAAGMMWLEPLAAPVALAALAHAWIIPELYAFRGASVVRPKARGGEAAGEAVAQGLLGDLLGHEERKLQRETGLALEHGSLGVWLVGEGGALLVTPAAGECTASASRRPTRTCRAPTAWRTCCSPSARTRRASPRWRTTRSPGRRGECDGGSPR